jgi:hypothetical protein
MKLVFRKGNGKYDALSVMREDGTEEKIACPKQGIIPHDMMHYAVEQVVPRRGFLTKLAAGEHASYRMAHEADAEAIERLVECFQAELWSGRSDEAALIAFYEHACAARGHAYFTVSAQEVILLRATIDRLAAQWARVPVGGSLELMFPVG